jgi:hypothetical protein
VTFVLTRGDTGGTDRNITFLTVNFTVFDGVFWTFWVARSRAYICERYDSVLSRGIREVFTHTDNTQIDMTKFTVTLEGVSITEITQENYLGTAPRVHCRV